MRPVSCLAFIITGLFASAAGAASLCLSIPQGLDRMCARDKAQDALCKPSGAEPLLAWKEESCVIINGDEVIPELTSLENGQEVPAEIYAKHSANKIAVSMLYRYFQKFERPLLSREDIVNPNYDLYDETEVILAFSSRYIDSIIHKGFLNQFVTASKPRDGQNYMQRRFSTENFLTELRLSDGYEMGDVPINHIRPKYAYGSFKSAGTAAIRNSFQASYGDNMAVLKSFLKKRTTFTNMDSLFGYVTNQSDLKRTSLYKPAAQFHFPGKSGYYEAQIWGKVEMQDVEYFLTGCFSGKADQNLLQALSQAQVPIPVYSCKHTLQNGVMRLLPDQRLQ